MKYKAFAAFAAGVMLAFPKKLHTEGSELIKFPSTQKVISRNAEIIA